MDFTEYDTRLAAYAVIVDGSDRILLAWYNGAGNGEPCWTLPGGGVEYHESVEEAVVREVLEETGHQVTLRDLLAVHSLTDAQGARRQRPFKAVRIVYRAAISGGSLGTLEVGGTTDRAAWIPLEELNGHERRADIVDIAVSAWRARAHSV